MKRITRKMIQSKFGSPEKYYMSMFESISSMCDKTNNHGMVMCDNPYLYGGDCNIPLQTEDMLEYHGGSISEINELTMEKTYSVLKADGRYGLAGLSYYLVEFANSVCMNILDVDDSWEADMISKVRIRDFMLKTKGVDDAVKMTDGYREIFNDARKREMAWHLVNLINSSVGIVIYEYFLFGEYSRLSKQIQNALSFGLIPAGWVGDSNHGSLAVFGLKGLA